MADWIFQGNPRHYDLDASVTASREQWWGTPRYRDRMAVGDRVWLQVVGPGSNPPMASSAGQSPGANLRSGLTPRPVSHRRGMTG